MKTDFAFRMVLKLCFLTAVCAAAPFGEHVQAQDFTDIGKRKPFTLSGSAGAQASTRLSTQQGYDNPFSYCLNIALTPSIYGFSLPVSLSFADSRLGYTQPFSRYSLQPSYKWVTAYIGRTSMDMHPYGLSNHQFDGFGVSLQPQKFPLKFMAMYGRFEKAREDSASAGGAGGEERLSAGTAYKRTGYALRLDFDHKKQRVGLHYFYAKDHAGSIPKGAAGRMTPAANAVLAFDFSFNVWENLNLYGQMGLSTYVGDLNQEKTEARDFGQKVSSLFIAHRPSSDISTALKVGVSYKWLSLSYERISPDYQSMGAYYFNQDFENLVLNFTHSFKRADLRAEIGWQHDDLDGDKANRQDRLVGSAYAAFRINDNFSLTGSYSNFTAYTQTKPVDLVAPDDPLVQDFDTVPFRQISQQAAVSFVYRTSKTAKYAQEAGFDLSYQSSRLNLTRNFSDYIYGTLRHSIVLGNDYRLQSAVNLSTCLDRVAGERQPLRYGIGPSLSLSKPFLDKTLQATASCSYYLDMSGKRVQSGVFGFHAGVNYTLKKAHHFGLNISTRVRSALGTATAPALSNRATCLEFQAQVSYRYQFSLDPFKNKKGNVTRRRA